MAERAEADGTDPALFDLYERDETAWLETMARLAADRRVEEIDLENLSEFLTPMAHRDRREVENRLEQLLKHLLKHEYQPGRRSRSWRSTIDEQRLASAPLPIRQPEITHAEADARRGLP